MPKGNGDTCTVTPGVAATATGQEHGECRKAMETGRSNEYLSGSKTRVRNTVNAERQWRLEDTSISTNTVTASQEHGECRKAMETRRKCRS